MNGGWTLLNWQLSKRLIILKFQKLILIFYYLSQNTKKKKLT